MEGDDAVAICQLGCEYRDGDMGLRQNYRKSIKLLLRAGELGHAEAHFNIAHAYCKGLGVERDTKKAQYYYELAAMGGNVRARHHLGILEMRAAVGGDLVSRYNLGLEASIGSMDRAMKHWMISAGAGHDDSLKKIRECFLNGDATKNDFEKALRTHKEAADEMKSEQREAAAAARAAGLGQN